jgi:hypothetical protein
MSLDQRIKSLVAVRNILDQFLNKNHVGSHTYSEFKNLISLAEIKNPWFNENSVISVLKYWSSVLTDETLTNWLSNYTIKFNKSKTIGLVLAGNIPMVGFHDCISALLTGNQAKIKLSSKDSVLIPFLLNLWKEFYKDLEFEFVDKLPHCDAVITTGTSNTARYFEYYFKNIPHIIRKNRTSIAIINGNETKEDLLGLANDIFTYFGLGCRSVTQLFLPANYDLNILFNAFISYKDCINHSKYSNNYEYNKAIYLMNQEKFWDNNFILLKESRDLFSPISTLYYSTYFDNSEVTNFIVQNTDYLQCVISTQPLDICKTVLPGQAQNPKINDYADGVDTLEFLTNL